MTIPHKVWINGVLLGIMKGNEVNIEIPEGHYVVTIQSMVPILSASTPINVTYGAVNVVAFHDREKWWDYLFVIDIVCWFADFFFTLPQPWGLIYKIFTNGYFVLWLLYEWLIRKKYFAMETYRVQETRNYEQDEWISTKTI